MPVLPISVINFSSNCLNRGEIAFLMFLREPLSKSGSNIWVVVQAGRTYEDIRI